MKSKTQSILTVTLGGTFILVLCLLAYTLLSANARQPIKDRAEPISIEGTYSINGRGEENSLLPNTSFSVKEADSVYVRGHFSRDVEKNEQIMMRINNLKVNLWINGTEMYTYGEAGTYPKAAVSSGNVWQSFVSPGIAADDVVEIELHDFYKNSRTTVYEDFLGSLYVGQESALIRQIFREQAFDIVSGIIALAVGIVIFILAIFVYRAKGHGQTDSAAELLYLSGFAICCGLWFLMDFEFISYVIPYPMFTAVLYQCSLVFMIVFALLFAMTCLLGRWRKLAEAAVSISVVVLFINVIRQFSGISDMHQAMGVELALVGIDILFLLSAFLYERFYNKNMAVQAAAVPMLILFAGTFAGAVNYITDLDVFDRLLKICCLVFVVMMSGRILGMLRRSEKEAQRAKELENELLQSKISVMLSQIKPHFLFNSLNAISCLCLEDPLKAEEAIVHFSDYLRGNIRSLEEQTPVPFTKELEHIKNYVSVEKMRFGDRLQMQYDIQFSEFEIPTLSLQPIVENAIKHGIGKRIEGGTVTLQTKKQGDTVRIVIQDDGVGFDPETKREKTDSIGMDNARKRLQHMCGGEVTVQSEVGNGTEVTIVIPLNSRAERRE